MLRAEYWQMCTEGRDIITKILVRKGIVLMITKLLKNAVIVTVNPEREIFYHGAIAIENVTGQSILALKDISKLHRNVITSLLSQFQVSEVAPQC